MRRSPMPARKAPMGRAVLRSVQMFIDFREKLGLSFKMLGIVPSRVTNSRTYSNRESKALEYLNEELASRFGKIPNPITGAREPVIALAGLPICNRVALLHIDGDDPGIFKETGGDPVIRAMFARLGNHVLEQIGLIRKPATEVVPDADIRTTPTVINFGVRAGASAG